MNSDLTLERSDANPRTSLLPWWRTLAWSFGLWTVVGLVTARGYMLQTRASGTSPPLSQIVGLSFPGWYVWAGLSIPVLALVAWVPIRRSRLLLRVTLHLAAALAFACLHLVCTVLLLRGLGVYPSASPLLDQVRLVSSVFLSYDLLIYAGLVGFGHALLAHRAFGEETLRSAERDAALARARLQGFLLELQPESLLGVLGEIAERVQSDSRSARRVLSRVGSLLSWSLEERESLFVPLSREVIHLDLYLDVLRELHPGRTHVRFDIDLDTFDTLVPGFMLQPLAERTIGDLVVQGTGPVRFDVRSRLAGESLVLLLEARAAPTDDGAFALANSPLEATVAALRARLRETYSAAVDVAVRRGGPDLSIEISIPTSGLKQRSVA